METQMSWRFTRRGATAAGLLLGWIVFSPSCVQAAPLGLHETHPGDVTTHFIYVGYTLDANPATGTLTATGYPDQFDVNNQNVQFDGNNSFSLTLSIDRATGAPLGGTVSIFGDTDGVPSFSGDLLEGNITQFGFPTGPYSTPADGNIFEFSGNVTGGALAGPYYGTHKFGIIMNISNGSSSPSFTGSFTAPFQNDGLTGLGGISDTFSMPAPEPSSLVLLALGLIPLVLRFSRSAPRRT
jgi:hypothetical protein